MCRRSSKVFVVLIGTCEGVLREMFGSWVGEIFHFASLPRIEKEAAQSKYAVSLFVIGGLEQIDFG